MTRLLSNSNIGLLTLTSLGLVIAAVACSSDPTPTTPGGSAGGNSVAGSTSQAGAGPNGNAGTAPGAAGTAPGAAGSGNTAGAPPGAAGSGTAGSDPIGTAGSAPTAGTGGVVVTPTLPPLVTSAPGAYWKTDATPTESTATATVTVNDTAAAQKWDGMGAAFNELGWKFLSSAELQTKAVKLLFSAT